MASDETAKPAREKRRYPRFPYPAKVIVIASGEVETLSARDIGAGGIFLNADRSPRVGSRVQVEFKLGARHFSVWGTVIREERAGGAEERQGFAVQFEAEPIREQLEHALSER